MGPCLGGLNCFKMSENSEARISIFDAAPNGGTLTDPGLIHPALGLAAGGFPWGRVAQSGNFQFILRPLRRGRSARSIGALVGSGS